MRDAIIDAECHRASTRKWSSALAKSGTVQANIGIVGVEKGQSGVSASARFTSLRPRNRLLAVQRKAPSCRAHRDSRDHLAGRKGDVHAGDLFRLPASSSVPLPGNVQRSALAGMEIRPIQSGEPSRAAVIHGLRDARGIVGHGTICGRARRHAATGRRRSAGGPSSKIDRLQLPRRSRSLDRGHMRPVAQESVARNNGRDEPDARMRRAYAGRHLPALC